MKKTKKDTLWKYMRTNILNTIIAWALLIHSNVCAMGQVSQ